MDRGHALDAHVDRRRRTGRAAGATSSSSGARAARRRRASTAARRTGRRPTASASGVPIRRSGAMARSPVGGVAGPDQDERRAPACRTARAAGTAAGGASIIDDRDPELVGRLGRELAQARAGPRRVLERPEHRAAEHQRPDRVQPVLERGGDAEVAAAAAQAPEQLGLGARRRRACARPSAVTSSTDAQVVDGQAVLAHQVAEPAAERQPADAGVADRSRRSWPGRTAWVARSSSPQSSAAGRARRARGRVDADRPSSATGRSSAPPSQHGVPGDGVAAAADRDEQLALAGEAHGLDDVVGARAARDQRRVGGRSRRSRPGGPRRSPPRRAAAARRGSGCAARRCRARLDVHRSACDAIMRARRSASVPRLGGGARDRLDLRGGAPSAAGTGAPASVSGSHRRTRQRQLGRREPPGGRPRARRPRPGCAPGSRGCRARDRAPLTSSSARRMRARPGSAWPSSTSR